MEQSVYLSKQVIRFFPLLEYLVGIDKLSCLFDNESKLHFVDFPNFYAEI